MKRLLKTLGFILALLILTIASLPIKSVNILASDTGLKEVTVTDNTETTVYRTGAKTVKAFFKEQGIVLKANDKCSHKASDSVKNGMTIQIRRGVNVNINVDGVLEKRRVSPGTTVEKLIAALQTEHNIALLYDGTATRTLEEGETLHLSTWHSQIYSYTLAIPFESKRIETTAVRLGTTQMRQEGIQGEKKYHSRSYLCRRG